MKTGDGWAKTGAFLAVLAAAAATSGCLEHDTRHTFYLNADGQVSWVVVQQDVRSNERDPKKRADEESGFIGAARLELHPVAMAFNRLMPAYTRTTIVRDRVPFMVVTDARFAGIDILARRMLDALGVRGQVDLQRTDTRSTLTVEIEVPSDDCEACGGDDTMVALIEDLDRYRFVIVDGRFVEVRGFAIDDRATTATPDEKVLIRRANSGDLIVLTLAWERRQ